MRSESIYTVLRRHIHITDLNASGVRINRDTVLRCTKGVSPHKKIGLILRLNCDGVWHVLDMKDIVGTPLASNIQNEGGGATCRCLLAWSLAR